MRIQHVSFSSYGGAGNVASNVARFQKLKGFDVRFTSLTQKNLVSDPFRNPDVTLLAAIDEYLIKKPSFGSPISVARSLQTHNVLDFSADLLHLHWVEGLVNWKDISGLLDLNRRVFWTLHDMRPITGACHFSIGCNNFQMGCDSCPAVRDPFRSLVRRNQKIKLALSTNVMRRINFIAPSSWLRDRAIASGLISEENITVIQNPIDLRYFDDPLPNILPNKNCKYLIVAGNLLDPRKNVIEAIQCFADSRVDGEILNLVGAGGESLASAEKGVYWLGSLGSEELREVFDESDCLLMLSTEDNSPLVVAECAARAKPAIVMSAGGAHELIEHQRTGLSMSSISDLSSTMSTFRNMTENRRVSMGEEARKVAFENHHPVKVAAKYLKEYGNRSVK